MTTTDDAKRRKPLKAQLDELTDRQVVERCMELEGMKWAYNQLELFRGPRRRTEQNSERGESAA